MILSAAQALHSAARLAPLYLLSLAVVGLLVLVISRPPGEIRIPASFSLQEGAPISPEQEHSSPAFPPTSWLFRGMEAKHASGTRSPEAARISLLPLPSSTGKAHFPGLFAGSGTSSAKGTGLATPVSKNQGMEHSPTIGDPPPRGFPYPTPPALFDDHGTSKSAASAHWVTGTGSFPGATEGDWRRPEERRQARIVLYDVLGTLLPRGSDSASLAEGSRLREHLQRLRANTGAVVVGLPISWEEPAGSLESRLRGIGVWELLGEKRLGIPELLGSLGPVGNVRWVFDAKDGVRAPADDQSRNFTEVAKLLGSGAVYVTGNSFMADKAPRTPIRPPLGIEFPSGLVPKDQDDVGVLVERAIWVRAGKQGRLGPLDESLIEAVALDMGPRGSLCRQPPGDPSWEDFLCCAEGCHQKKCCFSHPEEKEEKEMVLV